MGIFNFEDDPEKLERLLFELTVEMGDLERRIGILEKRLQPRTRVKPNLAIRRTLFAYGLNLYDLSVILGRSESTVYRMIRTELTQAEQDQIVKAIQEYVEREGD